VVAPIYARMLLRLSKSVSVDLSEPGGGEQLLWYYSIWPADTVADPWLSLSRRVYVETLNLPVLYSPVGAGRWVSPVLKSSLYTVFI
jgi:hypothetical protein